LRKTLAWFVVACLALVAVWWLLFRFPYGPSTSEQFAALRATGVLFSPAERCADYRPSAQDLTNWAARLRATEARLEYEDVVPALREFEHAPLVFWQARDWALDDASWKDVGVHLELVADEYGELADVFRTIDEYRTLDACALFAMLVPPNVYPSVLRVFEGLRAIQYSLLRSARRGDLDEVQRDLEASLLLPEKLRPVSLIYLLVWAMALDGHLTALEGSLPLLGERLDPATLERRLAAFQPRAFLLEALTWERSLSLQTLEWSLQDTPRDAGFGPWQRLMWSPARDMAKLTEGYELSLRHVRDEGVSAADLERFREELDFRMPCARTMLPMIQDTEKLLCALETRLALARSALRILAHGRGGWESVPRELDPRTAAPLLAEPLDERGVRLRAVDPAARPEEQRALEWTVIFR